MEKGKQQTKRERSRAYPGAALEECVQLVIKIKRNLGSGKHDRASLAHGMGYSKLTGSVNPKIAALVYFGFLDKKGALYWLSESSKKVTDPLTDDEKLNEIRDAFHRPTLFADLLSKFEPDGGIPARLEVHLHRDHGIADNATGKAAEIFRKSAVFAGIMDVDGRFLTSSVASCAEDDDIHEELDEQVEDENSTNPPKSTRAKKANFSTEVASTNVNDYTVSISGPKLQFSVIVSDETDLLIIEAMLKKVRTFIKEGGEAMHDEE
jgi:hypothetical protein